MARKEKKNAIIISFMDIVRRLRKPTPPPTRFFQDETKNVKKDRKDTKAKLRQGKYE